MRTRTIFLMLLLCNFISAQIKPRIELAYCPREQYCINESGILTLPSFSVKSGISYTWKFLTADFDNTFWMQKDHGFLFAPTQAKFDIGLEARKGNIKIRFSHTCLHPVVISGRAVNGAYGGCTKLSLSYGY